MQKKTLTTRFLDFHGGEQDTMMGELNMRMVAHPNRDGSKYWVKSHIANYGLYPASGLSDLMPNRLRQVFYRAKFNAGYDEAIARLKRFDDLTEDSELHGKVIEGKLLPPQEDLYIGDLEEPSQQP